jgi:hypothetical protein
MLAAQVDLFIDFLLGEAVATDTADRPALRLA